MSGANRVDRALNILRSLPRVCLANIRDNPGYKRPNKRGRGQHGGNKHGAGNKGSGQRQNHMPLGYETGNNPFYKRFPSEYYYRGHHLRRQYPPISLHQLQLMIDTNRVNVDQPIDLVALMNTGLFRLLPDQHQFGFNLTDEGADQFKGRVHIEVQWASELTIAAIERNGGVIRTAYYDIHSLQAMVNAAKFFQRGIPIPRRMLPPRDAVKYYSDPASRGYLADPEEIMRHRLVLAQKYGYTLPKVDQLPNFAMFMETKDPRQIFYGLSPGWVVNLKDRKILKPLDEDLLKFYAS